ncbi:hypothetical protein PAMA_000389 [Pampus argenteus]
MEEEQEIDGAPPLHTQLDSISQAGAREAGGTGWKTTVTKSNPSEGKKRERERVGEGKKKEGVNGLFLSLWERGMCWKGYKSTRSDCTISSTDISSNVADISRGFEDLISSVFEELCAALLTTLREALQQSRQHALRSGPYSTVFGAARSHSPVV